MNIGIPQIIYLILTCIGLLDVSYRHGKPKQGNENMWGTIIGTAIVCGLLYWSGFFSK